MSYWHLVLQKEDGSITTEKKVQLQELHDLHESRLLFYIEGQADTISSWRFTQYGDQTQVKDEYVCEFELQAAALCFQTVVEGVQIRQPPLDPQYESTSYIDLPYSTDVKYMTLLRAGDSVTFTEHKIMLKTYFICIPKSEANIEVESSAISQRSPIKNEDEDEMETDDDDDGDLDFSATAINSKTNGGARGDTQGDTQGPYSTSRERQSGSPSTPKAPSTRPSHMVQETPNHPTLQQQISTVSMVPDSLAQSERSAVKPRPAVVEETQFSAHDGNGQLTEHSGRISPTPLDALDSRDDDDGVEVDDAIVPINTLLAEDANAAAEPVPLVPTRSYTHEDGEFKEVSGHVLADDEAAPPEEAEDEMLGEGEGDVHEEVEREVPEEDQPNLSRNNGLELPEEDAVSEENETSEPVVQTPAPLPRATKRKRPSAVGSATRTTSTKRAKRTEADRLTEDSSNPLDSTPSNPAPRRFSPRVMISPSASATFEKAPPRIVFPSESTILQRKALMGFLKQHKVKQSTDAKPESFDMLCVNKGELKTTAKLLISLVHGKIVVTDDWVVQSSKAKKLLDPEPFLPDTLKESKDRDRSRVFENMTIYLTPKLRTDYRKGWDDIHNIIEQAGAAHILSTPPSKIPKGAEISLYLGAEKGDAHTVLLQQKGIDVFHKDIISHSIIKGGLILDKDEFGLPEAPGGTPTSSAASTTSDKGAKTTPASKAKGKSKGKGKKKQT